MTNSNKSQNIAELDAIQDPSDQRAADEFNDLRTSVVRRHIGLGAAQKNSHREAAAVIRQRMHAAQEVLDRYYHLRPTAPPDVQLRDREVQRATDEKRAYTQMLDVLKRACGATCCPGEPLEAP